MKTAVSRHFRSLVILVAYLNCAQAASASSLELLGRIQQLIQTGDLAGARSQLILAVKDFPKEAGFLNLLGVVDAQQGNYAAAESDFAKAIERLPQFTAAYLNLGRLYQENLGKNPEAVRKALNTYQKLLRYEPGNVEANYQSAVLLNVQGSFKASLQHLSRLPSDAQEKPQALAVRCADYAAIGELNQAQEAARRLLQRKDLTEGDILSILPVLEAHHRADLALQLLAGLVERQLASPDSLRQLGLLYERQGSLPQARETLEKMAQTKSDSVPVLLDLARIAYKQHDREGCLGYLAHARDLEPQNAGVHFFFGMVAVELDLPLEAKKSLKQALSLDPNNGYYNYALGAVSMQGKDPSESIVYFRKYCELKPEDPRGRFALGAAYFYSGDYEAARKELEGVVNKRETAAGAHYYLGRLEMQDGNLSEAVNQFQQALQTNPNYADAYAELGLAHIRQRQYEPAEKALRRALEIDPEGFLPNLNLLILYQRTKDNRTGAQSQRFEQIKKKRSEQEQLLLRGIEVRPY